MSRISIQTFTFALTLIGLSIPLSALDVPAGKAAVIEAEIGRVKVVEGGKTLSPKAGQVLGFGALIKTGSNGRVSLRHADNALTRLAPNTELTLTEPGKKRKGVFMHLAKGVIRFLVGQRRKGEVFEVSTANAVAAVKGTDAEVETDGTVTRGTVYSSEHEKALSFTDLETGKGIDLSPGESSVLKDEGFETRELDPADFKESDRKYKGLPPPAVVDEGAKDGKDPEKPKERDPKLGDKPKTDPPKEPLKTVRDPKLVKPTTLVKADPKVVDPKVVDTKILDVPTRILIEKPTELASLDEIVKETIVDLGKDIVLDQKLEQDDRNSDLVAGRIAYDRNGDRAQISSYVQRTDAATVVKSSYTRRDSGPYAGVSSAVETTVWNDKLPDDWTSVVKMALGDKANMDKYGDPIYFLVGEQFVATNPIGETLVVDRKYQRPYFDAGNDMLMPQGYYQALSINNKMLFELAWVADDTKYQSANTAQGYHPLADPATVTKGSWNSTVDFAKDGSLILTYDDGSMKFLQTMASVLTEKGEVVPVQKFSEKPHYLRDLRGIDDLLTIELTFASEYLKAPIDLMVTPALFDMMDFFDVPLTNG